MYFLGQGLKQDLVKAFEWYTKAALREDAEAQYNLGLIYKNGQGVEQDDFKAKEWFIKAAEQGHEDAQFNLDLGFISCSHQNQPKLEVDYQSLDVPTFLRRMSNKN